MKNRDLWVEFRSDYKANEVDIYSPYNPEFIEGIKALKGVWHPEEKCWTVLKNNIDEVRALATKVYGYTNYTHKSSITRANCGLTIQKVPEKLGCTWLEVSADKDVTLVQQPPKKVWVDQDFSAFVEGKQTQHWEEAPGGKQAQLLEGTTISITLA